MLQKQHKVTAYFDTAKLFLRFFLYKMSFLTFRRLNLMRFCLSKPCVLTVKCVIKHY
jgi:hypothetical protein